MKLKVQICKKQKGRWQQKIKKKKKKKNLEADRGKKPR